MGIPTALPVHLPYITAHTDPLGFPAQSALVLHPQRLLALVAVTNWHRLPHG